jgi:hypothetical protein
MQCTVFPESYFLILLDHFERTGIIEVVYIILGQCIVLRASELLNVYTEQWQR